MGRFVFFWGLTYAILKYGLLDMNKLIDLLSQTEYTKKTVDLIVAYPEVITARKYHV